MIALLLILVSPTFGDGNIYYNKYGEITIPELATHYRVGKVNPDGNTFIGQVREYETKDRPILEINYDDAGIKNGPFKYNRFGLLLEGEFVNNSPTISLPDSILEQITKKEQFIQATYIRKKDYPEIKHILSPIPHSTDSVMLNGVVYTVVEELPIFPGGMGAVGRFLGFNLDYPKAARQKGVTGKVFVQFTVARDGGVEDARVVKGIGFGCDESAVIAVSLLPDWKPGYQRGKAVPVSMVIPITFK